MDSFFASTELFEFWMILFCLEANTTTYSFFISNEILGSSEHAISTLNWKLFFLNHNNIINKQHSPKYVLFINHWKVLVKILSETRDFSFLISDAIFPFFAFSYCSSSSFVFIFFLILSFSWFYLFLDSIFFLILSALNSN